MAQPVKIKKIYHNGNHLKDKGNFCLSGSSDSTDVNISGHCEYIIKQHNDERGDSVLHQCFIVGVKSDNPIITKQCDSYQWKTDGISHFDDFVADRKNTFYHDYRINVCAGTEAGIGAAALEPVQRSMGDPLETKTITLSCGKLTTGVTVPEWTAVMMLTGSASTAAPGYMQTIFRVQSAGVLDGKQKERCYVFDFAPDRALNVLSEVNRVTKRGKTNEEEYRKALGEFLNFCPVIAVDGTQMTEYSVPKMMRQIKRLTVDKAIKSGFDDESVYKQDTGMVMDEEDVELFHTLSDKLSEQKAAKKETKIHINNQGLTNEEYEEASKLSNKPKRERSKEDEELLKKLQDQRKERDKVIRLLRNVSIRLPLLIYGAKVDLTEEIHVADFIDLVDPESWQEFMPKGVSTALFRKLLKLSLIHI